MGYAPTGQQGRHGLTRRVRIVVGEGRTAQQGLLRFVLEGEGFDVVGEAQGAADLPHVIEENEPDVVVLDDGIGVMAVSMVHEVAPQAKIVLVWPAAVVPIGGDARVEPAKILNDLGAAVTHVMAPVAALTDTFEPPPWVAKVRKDPVVLRGLLAAKAMRKSASVTRLQRRSKRLHPTSQPPRAGDGEVLQEGIPRRSSSSRSAWRATISSRCWTSGAARPATMSWTSRSRGSRSGTGAWACSPSVVPRP